MQFLIKFWYVILLAFVLSLAAGVGMILMQKDEWMPPPPVTPLDAHTEQLAKEGMSEEFARWNFEMSAVEDLRAQLTAEREKIAGERESLEALRARIAAETAELNALREDIDAMRESIRAEFNEIDEAETNNIRRLAKVYTDMDVGAAVTIFNELELALVVKILSYMDQEAAGRILAQMTQAGEGSKAMTERAALITDEMRRLRQ